MASVVESKKREASVRGQNTTLNQAQTPQPTQRTDAKV